MSLFVIDGQKCNSCGICAEECPTASISVRSGDGLPAVVTGGEERCINCGHCAAVCPTAALELESMGLERFVPVSRGLLPTAEQVEHFIRSRRSIRVFSEESVPHEVLERLIDLARYAPSVHNFQPVQWVVVEEREEVRRLTGIVVDWLRWTVEQMPALADVLYAKLMIKAWDRGVDVIMHNAPHVVVAHAHGCAGFPEETCAIAMTYLDLAAYSLGVGTCWSGYFQMAGRAYAPMREALGLPPGHQLGGVVMLGYPKHKFARIPLRNDPIVDWR